MLQVPARVPGRRDSTHSKVDARILVLGPRNVGKSGESNANSSAVIHSVHFTRVSSQYSQS